MIKSNCKLFFILLILLSCDRNDESDGTKFLYRNESQHIVELLAYFNNENNGSQRIESFKLEEGEEEEYVVYPENWTGPLGTPTFFGSDSIFTIFDDTLLIKYDLGSVEGNPMRIDNYKLVEGENDPYIYLFEFTNADYDRALLVNEILKQESL